MLKIALLDYVPQRYMRKANFETQETDRFLLGFKAGQRFATHWATKLVSKALSQMDLTNTIIVCIPASCKRTNDRRYKRFSAGKARKGAYQPQARQADGEQCADRQRLLSRQAGVADR